MKRIFFGAFVIGLAAAACIPRKQAAGPGGEPVAQGGEGKALQIATDPDRPSDSDETGSTRYRTAGSTAVPGQRSSASGSSLWSVRAADPVGSAEGTSTIRRSFARVMAT